MNKKKWKVGSHVATKTSQLKWAEYNNPPYCRNYSQTIYRCVSCERTAESRKALSKKKCYGVVQ